MAALQLQASNSYNSGWIDMWLGEETRDLEKIEQLGWISETLSQRGIACRGRDRPQSDDPTTAFRLD